MKKLIYLFLLLILFSGSVFGAIGGNGSYSNPFTGTLTTGSFEISGTIYFDQITVSGGTLIIDAGATLFAKATTSYIKISSTGALNATGSDGNIITFSADNNGDGSPSSGETWKNISFDLSTGTSLIDHAVIEHGTGDSYKLGGGLDIYGNNITIRNTIVDNCNITVTGGGNGGGVSVFGSGSNVSLQNLVIHNNTTNGNGGGLYVYPGSANINIDGCEIYNNDATNATTSKGDGVYLGAGITIKNSSIYNNTDDGVYINVANGTLTNCIVYGNKVGVQFAAAGNVVNSDIVNNTTNGVISASYTPPKLVNTVLWGNTTQYTIISGNSLVLANCGIQGGLSGGTDGGNNQNLSATNNADTGPNFVNTSSTPDLHISSWIAPLVDGGIASYSTVTAPVTDKEGHSRIGTLDIGAYEFVYYIWTGTNSTDWSLSNNWTGSPSSIPTDISENKVIIPNGCSHYPITSNLPLTNRSTLTIESQASLSVTGSTSVGTGCTFLLKSNSSGSANFITGSVVSGSYKIELYLEGGAGSSGNDYKWHFVTTPVDNHSKTALTTGIGNNYNLLNYDETVVTTDKNAGWQWHDGRNGTQGFSLLYIRQGYSVYVGTSQTALFTGSLLNSQDFVLDNTMLFCGSTDPDQNGWNLIGNPFTSTVNADDFIFGADFLDPAVDRVVYFTQNNSYSAYNTYTHIGTNGATNLVPSMQGFFVHVQGGGRDKSLAIPASSRLASSTPLYKGGQKGFDYPILKLNVSDNSTYTDETIIYFFKDAATTFDAKYDAYKMLSNNQYLPQIYTTENNCNFAMNGLPFPDGKTTVPLVLRIGEAKSYTINILNLENLTDYKVTLIHGVNRIDLKTNPNYTFSAEVGTINNMSIEFENITTDINVPEKDLTAFWYSNGLISIKTEQAGFENNSTVVIYDMNGREVFNKSGFNLGKGKIIEIPVHLQNGLYITTVLNDYRKLVKKIAVVE
jgi:hypothetical protein